MKDCGCIYAIFNTVNNKVYVGQTTQTLKKRFLEHKRACRSKEKRHLKLYDAMNQIGVENFYIVPLETNVPKNKLDAKEKFYIEKYNSFDNGYNATIGGKGGECISTKFVPQIINAYKLGNSCSDIARQHHTSSTTIYRILLKYNVEIRHDGNKYEQFAVDLFVEMWKSKNITRKEMAKIFNVDSKTIKRFASRIGLNRKGVTTIENHINVDE